MFRVVRCAVRRPGFNPRDPNTDIAAAKGYSRQVVKDFLRQLAGQAPPQESRGRSHSRRHSVGTAGQCCTAELGFTSIVLCWNCCAVNGPTCADQSGCSRQDLGMLRHLLTARWTLQACAERTQAWGKSPCLLRAAPASKVQHVSECGLWGQVYAGPRMHVLHAHGLSPHASCVLNLHAGCSTHLSALQRSIGC